MKKAAPVNDLHHDSVQQAHDNVTESLFKIYLGRVSYRYKLFHAGRNSSKPDKKNSTPHQFQAACKNVVQPGIDSL